MDLTIPVLPEELEALQRLSERQLRTIHEQARYLLIRELRRERALPRPRRELVSNELAADGRA